MSKKLSDLNRLVRGRRTRKYGSLPYPEARSDIGPSRGIGLPIYGGESSGIASPLTEVGSREYWDNSTITSSDGLFVLVFKRPKVMNFEDAEGRPVQINYIDPNA